ncbi:SMEK domain-containing protein [Citrobacter sp. Ca225]|uniref:SMEK domain-containing protein n=1 Tax=Citrobacter sp. Ca225 TaxID=2985002 RepID=UPI002579B5A4|nr:SMEK domain-containing protein [Citrobacter sp. Ca225]MDM3520557.1 SMEK domain-containing protein [Citrobacter sp. Ca225]
MLTRQVKNNNLTFAFSLLSTVITFNSKQSMFDINKTMELVLTDLLNDVYNLSLVNLNLIKHNHPAIDLGDITQRIAIQVTSDGSKAKFDKTMDMLVKHGLDADYDNIWIMLISNDKYESYTRKGFSTHVRNLSDVASCICQKPGADFDRIYTFCENNFGDYFPGKNTNILELTQVASVNPNQSVANFVKNNQLDLSYDDNKYSESDIRDDLIILKSKLSELNEMQRMFIFRVMEFTLTNDNSKYIESCKIPVSAFMSGRQYNEKYAIKQVADYLEQIRLAYYDEENYSLGCATYTVYFKGNYPEFDYLTGIVEHLRVRGTVSDLRKIIYECDFSILD